MPDQVVASCSKRTRRPMSLTVFIVTRDIVEEQRDVVCHWMMRAAEARGNALFLAKACDLAYSDPAEACPRFRSELGLEAKLISVDNTQVYVGVNDQAVVVAFRGSQAPTTLDGLKDGC